MAPTTMTTSAESGSFAVFFEATEPRLRRALVAAYGPERGREATAEALAYGWEHWDRVRAMGNPAGYLYRVGQSRTRPRLRPRIPASGVVAAPEPVEPGLAAALDKLSRRQRTAVMLVHGYGWTAAEVGDLTGTAASTVETHLQRALARLRADLGDPQP